MLLSVYFCSSTIKVMKNSGDNETMYIPYKDKDLVYSIRVCFFINKKMLPWRCFLSFFFFLLIVNPYFLLIHIHIKIVTYAYVFKSVDLI